MIRSTVLLLAPLLLAAEKAEVPPACLAPLPAGLAAWTPGASLAAATDARSLAATRLAIDTRTEAMLAPSDGVRFAAKPGKPGEPTSKGGMLGFTVAKAGTYRIAIGAGAWVDVVRGGKALKSVAHAHGPACSGVRKMVDFALTPGRYVLQIENSRDPVVPVLVMRL